MRGHPPGTHHLGPPGLLAQCAFADDDPRLGIVPGQDGLLPGQHCLDDLILRNFRDSRVSAGDRARCTVSTPLILEISHSRRLAASWIV